MRRNFSFPALMLRHAVGGAEAKITKAPSSSAAFDLPGAPELHQHGVECFVGVAGHGKDLEVRPFAAQALGRALVVVFDEKYDRVAEAEKHGLGY